LPEDSALAGDVARTAPAPPVTQAPSWRGWGPDRHLLASIYDALQAQTVVIAKAAGAKGIRQPDPWPRPGQLPKGRSMASLFANRSQARQKVVNTGG